MAAHTRKTKSLPNSNRYLFLMAVMVLSFTIAARGAYALSYTQDSDIGKAIYLGNVAPVDLSKAAPSTVAVTNYYGSGSVALQYYKTTITNQSYDCDCVTSTITSANSTKYDERICKVCYKSVSSTDLVALDSKAIIAPNQPVYETFSGCKQIVAVPGGWGCSLWTDVNINGEKIEGATWFNMTYGARLTINATNTDNKTHVLEPLNFTMPVSAHAIRSCKNEIAIVNYSNDVVYDLKHIEVAQDSAPACVYRVLVNISAGYSGPLFYAYYNTTGIVQNLGPIELFNDDFGDASINGNIWSTTGSVTEADGYIKLADADATKLDTGQNTSWKPPLTIFYRANSSSNTYTGVWNIMLDVGTYGSTNSSGLTDGGGTGGNMNSQTYTPASDVDLPGFTYTAKKWNYYVVQTNISTTAGQAYLFARSWGESHDEVVGQSVAKAWVYWTSAQLHSQGNNNIAGWFDFVKIYKGIVNIYQKAGALSVGPEELSPQAPPFVGVDSPINATYSNTTVNDPIWFNVTTNITVTTCVYNVNGTVNRSMSGGNNIWFANETTLPPGTYCPVFYCYGQLWGLNDSVCFTFIYNITYPAYVAPFASYCADDSLVRFVTTTSGGVAVNYTNIEYCAFGCDDVSLMCRYDPTFIYLALIALFGFFIMLIIFIARRSN